MARELAILVTAKNMASRVLNDVRGDVRGLQSEARRGVTNTVRNLSMIGVAAGGAIAVNVQQGLESLAELERVNAQTNAALKSTGNTAAGTVADIRKRSKALEGLTTVDDKVIQNAQNLLLTFPQIGEKAFEPTLQSALDLNAALGGDDESLQQVLIQVAKAVNDPITGLTALRRSGVSFTDQQREQIKTMMEAGDVAGAQAIVLQELNNQFGGSAAAQAETYGGKIRRLKDAVEGAQMALATAFLPVIEKVSDKIETLLSDPQTLKNIESFGGEMAEGFDQALSIAERLPWDAIGTTFSLMGQGAKAALDLFTKMPPWVQTAVLTGWGLNKLSGGALGNIIGSLGRGALGGLRGQTPATPVYVQPVGGGLGGPGIGGPAGRGGRGIGGGILGLFSALGVAELADLIEPTTTQAGIDLHDALGLPDFPGPDDWQWPLGNKNMPDWAKFNPGSSSPAKLGGPGQKTLTARNNEAAAATAARQGQNQVPQSIDDLRTEYQKQTRAAAVFDSNMIRTAERATQANQATAQRTDMVRAAVAAQGARLSAIEGLNRSSLGTLAAIRNKRTVFNPHVNVTANISNVVSISTGQILKRVNSVRQSANAGTAFAGFI